MEKILCIQLRQIGDVLMTTPAIRALAQNNPNAEIHLLVQPPCDQVYAYNPYLTKLITAPKKLGFKSTLALVNRLRKEKYTTIIDFLSLPNTAFFSWMIGARKRIGFKKRGRSLFYTDAVTIADTESYSGSQKLFLLRSIGIETDDTKLDFFISKKEKDYGKRLLKTLGVKPNRPLVTVSPVSRRDYKVWPAENFARVCDHLVERHSAQILFLWGPGEYHFVKKVNELMKWPALPRYEVPTISETLGILENVDFHFGNDNGPMHFAIAAGVPSLAVFGRPLMKNWIPPQSTRNLGIEFDPGCKQSCHYPECELECLMGVSTEEVIKKIDDQMNAL